MAAFSLRSARICQTSAVLSCSPLPATPTEAFHTWCRIASSSRCCITGNIDGIWSVKRHAGASSVARFFAFAFASAAAFAEAGRPASFASSRITSSQALVESKTFSEYCFVSFESSASIAAMRAFRSGGRSAPDWANSCIVSSTKRRRTGSSPATAPEVPKAFKIFQSSSLSGIDA